MVVLLVALVVHARVVAADWFVQNCYSAAHRSHLKELILCWVIPATGYFSVRNERVPLEIRLLSADRLRPFREFARSCPSLRAGSGDCRLRYSGFSDPTLLAEAGLGVHFSQLRLRSWILWHAHSGDLLLPLQRSGVPAG